MNTPPRLPHPSTPEWRPIEPDDVDRILAIEKTAYSHPWTRGNFLDSLQSGHHARLLEHPDGTLLGYLVAMQGVDEIHLLNLTVAPEHQGLGWARHMLEQLVDWSRRQGAAQLWLEVRASNARARRLYVACGFQHQGERKNYYPGLGHQRENAVLMSRTL